MNLEQLRGSYCILLFYKVWIGDGRWDIVAGNRDFGGSFHSDGNCPFFGRKKRRRKIVVFVGVVVEFVLL
jgi:hypothetical protein